MTTREGSTTRFPLGSVYMTPNAMGQLTDDDVLRALARHGQCDWGDVGAEDKASNDAAFAQGARLLSVYLSAGGVRFWIITEWDRSGTTVLMPEDY